MSNYKHLFKINQQVIIKFEDDKKTHKGTITETATDYIIVDVPDISDHCYFDCDNIGCVYPDYNFK